MRERIILRAHLSLFMVVNEVKHKPKGKTSQQQLHAHDTKKLNVQFDKTTG